MGEGSHSRTLAWAGQRVHTWLDEQCPARDGSHLYSQACFEESREMPNDAKLGLIVGVGVVLAVAVIFFRKDGDPAPSVAGGTTTAGTAKPIPASSAPPTNHAVEAKQTGQTESAIP